jgi:hypothetical protein
MSKQRVRKLDEAGLRKLVQGMLEEAFGHRSSEYYGGPEHGYNWRRGREHDEPMDAEERRMNQQIAKHNAEVARRKAAAAKAALHQPEPEELPEEELDPTKRGMGEGRVRKLDEAGLRRLVRSMLRRG